MLALRRRVSEVLNSPRLVYHGVRGALDKVQPPDVDGNGSQIVTIYDLAGNPISTEVGVLVTMMRQIVDAGLNTTIANGAVGRLSPQVDISGASMGLIQMPALWTAADITFQVAPWDNATFFDLYDENGSEVVMTVAAARTIPIPPEVMAARYIKIRSGTTGTPVDQATDRILQLILKG